MNWNNFQTYGDAPTEAFETLCNHLFERHLKTTYSTSLVKFRVVNGAAGDGGIEAYGLLENGDIVAVQSKWFRNVLTEVQFKEIKKSIDTAMALRPNIKKYLICIPRDINSLKYGRGPKGKGKQPVQNHEDKAVDDFSDDIENQYPDLKLEWWFENEINLELLTEGNVGVNKFWFEKEVVSLKHLIDKFAMQKKGWLHQRYIPELHAQGVIQQTVHLVRFAGEYRTLLNEEITKAMVSLRILIKQIDAFIPTNITDESLNDELRGLKTNINEHLDAGKLFLNAIIEGNDKFQPTILAAFDRKNIRAKIQQIVPTQPQLALVPELLSSLKNYGDYVAMDFGRVFLHCMRLILGEPGTGKTHGLVNAVETHLSELAPALIIQAKGASSQDWDSLLRDTLALPSWSKEEICSALETMAMRRDIELAKQIKAGQEVGLEATKVLICIDGLEEDLGKEKIWYERMRECEMLHSQYPNIRFLFSARRYFHNSGQTPQGPGFAVVMLPREGDVSVMSVADRYFSKEYFDITLESPKLIKGIDSLFALRLFCEQYRGRTLTKAEDILTASDELLNKKIERIESEFREGKGLGVSNARSPILESLLIIADHFYHQPNIEHDELARQLKNGVGDYFTGVDTIIDFLADNGMLIKSELTEVGRAGIKVKKYNYTIVSNSIIELIIANRVSEDISSGTAVSIPPDLVSEIIDIYESAGEEFPSANFIVQNIVDLQFKRTGKLIGDNGFLIEGLNQNEITALRQHALIKADHSVAAKYDKEIQEILLQPGIMQLNVLTNLILPASQNNQNYFGANFLHHLLNDQSSAFERDEFWSGQDTYVLSGDEAIKKHDYSISAALAEYTGGDFTLSKYALHDELPLIYAWALSHINQEFRDKLRVALTQWAKLQPSEFLLLLDRIFHCNDPQIQEDLSSIMLGVASKLKDQQAIQALAIWALEHVFTTIEENRNIIVRQGMRSIVEKAFQFNLIGDEQVLKARPGMQHPPTILPLDKNALENQNEEIYPIVHDLAWYVLKKSFENFLEYPMGREKGIVEDQDCPEGKSLLDLYRKELHRPDLYAYAWAMAAAIGYMKRLGFSKTKGHSMTQESHGAKSRVFTLEEKYTWLAVHYLQGYLSDYVPRDNSYEKRLYVTDYSVLEPIPSPIESPFYKNDSVSPGEQRLWVLHDSLSREIGESESEGQFIKREVGDEPAINFKLWMEFQESDFIIQGEETKLLAVYNSSAFHDSRGLVFSRLELRAGLISKGKVDELIQNIQDHPEGLYFLQSLDQLQASPETHTYSNPSDLVWMNWIGESGITTVYYDQTGGEKEITHTLTDVTKNTIDGEEYLKIPSAFIRELCDIVEMEGNNFLNKDGQVVAFLHSNADSNNSQEMVVINKTRFLEAVDKKDLELIWFVEHFKRKNMLNKDIEHIEHVQKVRKYLVAYQNGEYRVIKFWDSWASNR